MPILGGFHAEGNDYLILHAIVAKLLVVEEAEIEVDFIDSPGRGWQFVLDFIPNALKRFYARCAQFAVVGIDNDGNVDLDRRGGTEDPSHPRHSNHIGNIVAECRFCTMLQKVAEVRPSLNWIQQKPGATWPILIAVPVEMIETWLLLLQGYQGAQRRPRNVQKQQLYGKPVATRTDVTNVALPLVRSMTPETIAALTHASPSFRDFYDQIIAAQVKILGGTDCW